MRRSFWLLFILGLVVVLGQRLAQRSSLGGANPTNAPAPITDRDEREQRVIQRQERGMLSAVRQQQKIPARGRLGSQNKLAEKVWTLDSLQKELDKRKAQGSGAFQHPTGTPQKAAAKRPLSDEEKTWLEEAKELCADIADANERKACVGQYMRGKKEEAEKRAQAERTGQPNNRTRFEPSASAGTPSGGPLSGGIYGVGAGLPPNTPAEEVAGADWQRTPEQWATLLLAEADFGLVTLFISYFENSFIPASTFYGVVRKMLSDPRNEIRKLGVMALASSPGTTSFLELVNLDQSTAQRDALKSNLRSALNTYLALDHLNYLSPVIRSGASENAQIEALNMVNGAANAFMDNSAPSATPSTPEKPPSDSFSIALQTFRNLLKSVESALAAKPSSASVTSALTQTRELLNQLIKQSEVARNQNVRTPKFSRPSSPTMG